MVNINSLIDWLDRNPEIFKGQSPEQIEKFLLAAGISPTIVSQLKIKLEFKAWRERK